MRILIVDEKIQRARALQAKLAPAGDVLVTGCVSSLAEAAEAGAHNDVVLLRRIEKVEAGRKLVRTLAVTNPHVKVLVVGVREDDWEAILPYLESGAAGYVTAAETVGNGAGENPVLEKVRAAHRNEAIISPRVAGLIMRRIAQVARTNRQASGAVSWPPDTTVSGLSAD